MESKTRYAVKRLNTGIILPNRFDNAIGAAIYINQILDILDNGNFEHSDFEIIQIWERAENDGN